MMSNPSKATTIPRHTLSRLPYYARCIARAKEEGQRYISAPAIAAQLNLHEVQVRKDLAAISSGRGVPKKGFPVEELLLDVRRVISGGDGNDAVLVGAGSLGRALLSYNGFDEYGMHIVAAFDADETVIGKVINGKKVFPLSKLQEIVSQLHIPIGIITVPAAQAQSVCDSLIEGGVQAIWNFAPVRLSAPEPILIQNENMAASLMMLSQHLNERMARNEGAPDRK